MGSHTNKVWLQQRLQQFCFQCLILPEAVLRINMHSFQTKEKGKENVSWPGEEDRGREAR